MMPQPTSSTFGRPRWIAASGPRHCRLPRRGQLRPGSAARRGGRVRLTRSKRNSDFNWFSVSWRRYSVEWLRHRLGLGPLQPGAGHGSRALRTVPVTVRVRLGVRVRVTITSKRSRAAAEAISESPRIGKVAEESGQTPTGMARC